MNNNDRKVLRITVAKQVRGEVTPPFAAGQRGLVVKRYPNGDTDVLLRENGQLVEAMVNNCDVEAVEKA
jgi:hypothetical protein